MINVNIILKHLGIAAVASLVAFVTERLFKAESFESLTWGHTIPASIICALFNYQDIMNDFTSGHYSKLSFSILSRITSSYYVSMDAYDLLVKLSCKSSIDQNKDGFYYLG